LTANFDSASAFQGGSLNIYGTLPSVPGTSGTPNGLLYSANLTAFGYDASQSAVAFTTLFNPSWSNQPALTGGSLGEVVYLFDQAGLASGAGAYAGALGAFIEAAQGGNLSSVSGETFTGVRSIATVPLPLPAVLFGTGLTALLGVGRKRGAIAESV